jgi:putative heme iron utilization protein
MPAHPMDAEQTQLLQALLTAQPVAALATLHKGEPAASMVPYALLPNGRGVVIHVSRLATHTADMLAQPDALYAEARACYLARLPGSEEMFSFGDFSLFVIDIRAVRFVAGFGRAHGLTPEAFAQALSGDVSP